MNADLIRMSWLAASLLQKPSFDMLMAFDTPDELVQATTPEMLVPAEDLYALGLISKTLVGGYIFLQPTELGNKVREGVASRIDE